MKALVLFALLFGLHTAHAQPGQSPEQLTVDDQALLAHGYISTGQQIGGGLTAMMFGFGLGQAVEGRWSDTGWIFTLGDSAATLAFTVGLFSAIECTNLSCPNAGRGFLLMALGAGGGAVLRLWGTVDAVIGPQLHNRRVRDLRARLGYPYAQLSPYVAPPRDGAGAVGGLAWRF